MILLALIGDSTNANVPRKSESEKDVRDELTSIFSRFSTNCCYMFFFNIARRKILFKQQRKIKERLLLVGGGKKYRVVRKCSYVSDDEIFISEYCFLYTKRKFSHNLYWQSGEKRSALFRIAYNSHQIISREPEDVVIFSSRDIPGNEKSINNLKNLLIRQKVDSNS